MTTPAKDNPADAETLARHCGHRITNALLDILAAHPYQRQKLIEEFQAAIEEMIDRVCYGIPQSINELI